MRSELSTESTPSILIVDDTPANLQLLSDMLRKQGFKVRPTPSGELALRAAALAPPDLILLDINMPGLSGYEVCQRLKEDPAVAPVPVIFVTAHKELTEKVRGFSVGAVDYITKPFQFEEVEARVRTHLELARLRRELEHHKARLEESVAERTRELAEAKARLAILDHAKSDFLHLISHEVRTPLNGVLGIAEILLANTSDASVATYTTLFEQSRRRLMTLIDDALLLSQIGAGVDDGVHQACPLTTLLDEARAQAMPFAESRSVHIAPSPIGLSQVQGSPEFLVRALQSLLETAVKFAEPNSTVRLASTIAPTEISLVIEADGSTIADDALPRFFDLLAIAEPITPGGDLGLAPSLAERIVSLYGGTVSVENLSPPGVRLGIRLRSPETPSAAANGSSEPAVPPGPVIA